MQKLDFIEAAQETHGGRTSTYGIDSIFKCNKTCKFYVPFYSKVRRSLQGQVLVKIFFL